MSVVTPLVEPDVDALLIIGFGGPEAPDEVLPFLENVTRGRGVPPERLAEVGEHYQLFGGRSPINDQVRALKAAVEADLAKRGPALPVYWGNRNWPPMLVDAVQQMADDGVGTALAFVTSAYSSYSGCRQYREDVADAQLAVGEQAPRIVKLRHYADHPGHVLPLVGGVRAALAAVPADRRTTTRVAFSAHSIPTPAAASAGPRGDGYVGQLQACARAVVDRLDPPVEWDLVFQSRSGPPAQPWLEPDIVDHVEAEHTRGTTDLVVVPIGFTSDHMEVVYDLDTEARKRAEELGLHLHRVPTVGTAPEFVRMVRDLVVERMAGATERTSLSPTGASHDVCPRTCCPARLARPASMAPGEEGASYAEMAAAAVALSAGRGG